MFLSVLAAAALHAVWNGLVKGAPDKFVTMTAVVAGHVPVAAIGLAAAPLPSLNALPFLAAGVILHCAYQFFLLWSYRVGDLTQVYPVARGSAPLIIAGISVSVLGVMLEPREAVGILIIAAGLFCLALVKREEGTLNLKAAGLALVTGCFIAAYSIIDGMGARLAGTPLGYFSWLAVANGFVFIIVMFSLRPDVPGRVAREAKTVFWVGGSASFTAYAIVTWAFTKAPIALVSALRETSIIFALFIGVFVLRERLDLMEVGAAITTMIGAAVLRASKG